MAFDEKHVTLRWLKDDAYLCMHAYMNGKKFKVFYKLSDNEFTSSFVYPPADDGSDGSSKDCWTWSSRKVIK